VKFRFLFRAEFIEKGSTILLRDGRTKILGVITDILIDQNVDNKVKV
jgi:GTPase